jgi:trehalose 6-phosphate synthase/phosphatase
LITRLIDKGIQKEISTLYSAAQTRLIFLDYDGTLSSFTPDPQAAGPDKELHEIIAALTEDKKNRVVIISGRDRNTLGKWFTNYPVDMICEHGVWLREHGKDWHQMEGVNNEWQPEIRTVLKSYVDRTPGSFVEEKDYSLVWHYRKVETGLGELRTRELTSHMRYLVTNKNLQVMEGNKVIEIKNSVVDKGVAAGIWLKNYPSDFVMAIGDDWTDEDTFRALHGEGITIKVGRMASEAKYCVEDVAQVRNLLNSLIKGK